MSLGLETSTDIGLFLQIQEAFDETKQCEHSQHAVFPEGHNGEAVWYFQIACPKCGEKGPIQAVCDKWKSKAGDAGEPVICSGGCDEFSYDWYVLVCEKIRK